MGVWKPGGGAGLLRCTGVQSTPQFPTPGAPAIGSVKASPRWKPGPMQTKSSLLRPFPPILSRRLFSPRGTESSFRPLCLQSFKPDLFPPGHSSSTGPAPSLSTDPCWMPGRNMSTVPALPIVYRLGGLFPLTLKTSEIDPSPPSSLGPCRNPRWLSCFRLYPCSMPTAPQFCFGICCFLCQTFVAWHRGLQHQLGLSP